MTPLPLLDSAHFSTLLSALEQAFKKPLPGYEAQYKMARTFREHPLDTEHYHAKAKQGAVLLLLYPGEYNIETILIERPKYDGVHSGQMALPGGKKEDVDPDLSYTALRETQEEIGVLPSDVRILGSLTPLYVPPSNFLVTPFVGALPNLPTLNANPEEVQEICRFPMVDFLRPEAIATKQIQVMENLRITAPYYGVGGKVVWGATAMIISEFNELLLSLIHSKSP